MRDPMAWRDDAACAGHDDPDIWTETTRGTVHPEAFRVCSGCPVRRECLDYALSLPLTEDAGVFGGTSEGSRRRVRFGRMSHAEAMARGDAHAELRTETERLADDEPWLLGASA